MGANLSKYDWTAWSILEWERKNNRKFPEHPDKWFRLAEEYKFILELNPILEPGETLQQCVNRILSSDSDAQRKALRRKLPPFK